jgi:tripartite-type tricarboxylate transporter receptor subunit TctC
MAQGRALPIAALLLCGAPLQVAAQDAVAEFYRGKQVSILVGFSAGGSSSLYAQAISRVMGRHLPGNPAMIVQHMPGAGGLTVVNHVFTNALRDGTIIGTTNRTAPFEPLLGNKAARFDARKLGWLGTANVEYTTCIGWHSAPVTTLKEAMEKELIVGGTGPGASEVVFPRAANALAGTKFKVVLGYPGSTEMLLAMERGETGGFCGIGWTFVKLRKGDWLREKKINILFQIALKKHPELPDVPLILDHAKTPENRTVFEFLLGPQEMGRPFFAPPEVPADRLAALRTAFELTFKDAAFLAEAERMGIEVQHLGGEHVGRLVERLYATPQGIVDRARVVTE